jgi:hypothetical protein
MFRLKEKEGYIGEPLIAFIKVIKNVAIEKE